jgi:DNA polymerase-3 subunit gamma/tau
MPPYLVLARKYRPAAFRDLVGQDHVVRTLTNSIVSGRVAHAFLLCGVRGVGKTTVARILAKSLNCHDRDDNSAEPCGVCVSCREISQGVSVDVQEIDGASNTSVENIREINENIKYPPVGAAYKIIIIDEVHMISINAFNALLKSLEEPPGHVKFIFATTESHKVPATINSRCQRFNFRTLSVDDLIEGMSHILEQEQIEASQEALAIIALEAQGSFRDGLSLLDQVISFTSEKIDAQSVNQILGLSARDSLGKLVDAILERDCKGALEILHQLFHQGSNPEQLCADLLKYLRNLTVVKAIDSNERPQGMLDATPSQTREMEQLADKGRREEFQNLFAMAVKGAEEARRSQSPWVALEMTMLRMASAPKLTDLSSLIQMIKSGSLPEAPSQKPQRAPLTDAPKPSGHIPDFENTRDETHENSKNKTRNKRASAPIKSEPHDGEQKKSRAAPRFFIEEVRPVPEGTNDEIWRAIKKRIEKEIDNPMIHTIIEHGGLISFGPSKVEIGFTKLLYTDQFIEKLEETKQLKDILQKTFGDVKIDVLTLAQKTPIDTQDPYASPEDGQSDLRRALKQEAIDHPITRAVLKEFKGSSVEEIKIL